MSSVMLPIVITLASVVLLGATVIIRAALVGPAVTTTFITSYDRYQITVSVLTPADAENHIDKTKFTTPFVCGARNLGEALRRIAEGAAMIRTKGEAGTGQ